MCTGYEVAALVMMAAGTATTIHNNNQAAEAQAEAQVEMVKQQYANSQDTIREINESTEQQYTDRMRQARREISALSASLGEAGAVGASGQRVLYEAAYGENVDLMRIASNAKSQLDKVNSQNFAASKGASLRNAIRAETAKNQNMGAVMNFGANASSVGISSQNRKDATTPKSKGG